MRDPTITKALDTALTDVSAKAGRTPRFDGDKEALDAPLNDDEKRGYEKAVGELRKAIFGDTDEARELAVNLLSYVPGYFPEGAKPQYGESETQDPDGEYNPRAWENCNFFSEHYLYELFGKDDARSILGRLHSFMDAVGIVHWKLGPEIHKVDEQRKERHEQNRAYRARQYQNALRQKPQKED